MNGDEKYFKTDNKKWFAVDMVVFCNELVDCFILLGRAY